MSSPSAANTPASSPSNGGELFNFDLHAVLGSFRENLRLFFAVLGTGVLLTFFVLYIVPPTYSADALLSIEKAAPLPGLEAINSLLSATAEVGAPTEAYNFRSRDLAQSVVSRLRLDVKAHPRYFPIIGHAVARHYRGSGLASAPFGLGSYAWGGESIGVGVFDVSANRLGGQYIVEALADRRFRLFGADDQILLESAVGDAKQFTTPDGPIRISISELVARPGTQFWLRRVDTLYAAEALRADLEAAPPPRYIGGGLMQVSYEAESATAAFETLRAFVQAYVRQNIDARSEQAEKMVGFIDSQLPTLKAGVTAAETALNNFRASNGSSSLQSSSHATLDQLVTIDARLSDLRLQKAEMLLQVTEQFPAVQALEARRKLMLAQRAEIEQQAEGLPKAEFELLKLTRDLEVSNQNYVSLLNRAQELKLAKAGEIGNVRIVDSAILPKAPIKPKPFLIVGLGLAISLLLSIAAVAIRELLRQGVRDPAIIESRFNLPVLASVGFSQQESLLTRATQILIDEKTGEKKPGGKLLAYQSPKDLAVESIRSLRTALQFALFDTSKKSIVFTGPAPGVGKSFISANLAVLLQQVGEKKVLIVDADMRKGRLHDVFGVPRTPGLSQLLANTAQVTDCLKKVADNLYLLPNGPVPPNPAELLQSETFANLLAGFEKEYDYVLIDTPPVLAVSDSGIVSKIAGAVILVLRHDMHPIAEIEHTIRRLQMSGANIKGVVINAVSQNDHRYGGYRYGNYQYRYE